MWFLIMTSFMLHGEHHEAINGVKFKTKAQCVQYLKTTRYSDTPQLAFSCQQLKGKYRNAEFR